MALGASPAMVHAEEEVEDFVGVAHALVVNIGTLSPPWVTAMERAAARAGELGVGRTLVTMTHAGDFAFAQVLLLRA